MTNETNTTTVQVPTFKLDSLMKEVEKLNRKGKKNGFDAIEVTLSDTYTEERTVYTTFEGETNSDERLFEFVDVTFTDYTRKVGDYTLVGLTTTEDGITLLNTLDESFNLKEHRGTCACDHCNTKRKRNKVYFLSENGKDIIRVGSTCVSDFFASTVSGVLNKFDITESLHRVISEYEEDGWGYSSAPRCYKATQILTLTILAAKKFGWTSVTKSKDEYIPSTKDNVLHILNNSWDKEDTPTEEEVQKANIKAIELVEWVKSINDDSEYIENVKTIIEAGHTPVKMIGYIVGIYGWYQNHLNQKAKQELVDANPSTHMGTIGVRQTFVGRVVRVHTYTNDYGVGYITTVDCDGDVVVYFNSLNVRGKNISADVDDMVTFDAAVKKHDEFRGVAQTTVSRATKVKIESPATV